MEFSQKLSAQRVYDHQEEEQFSYAMQLVTSTALPMVLHAAVQLEVFEIISRAGPEAQLSPSEIASHLPTKNPEAGGMLDRMLRLLASYSVLTCSITGGGNDERLYGLAPVTKYFVQDEDGATLAPMLTLALDQDSINFWLQIKDSVLEGGSPFDRIHGTHAFEYFSKDSRLNEAFNQAMKNHSTIVVKKILEHYNGFNMLKTLVDVGGGVGSTLNKITLKYPAIKGINFDLPHVIKHAPPYTGVKHVEGDMFESIPRGDAVLLKWILHDWSDDQCIKLLRNCYDALPIEGKVIVIESILPMKPNSSASAISTSHMHVAMMAQLSGGKERSEHEFLSLAKAGGFRGIKLESFVCNIWVMEFYK